MVQLSGWYVTVTVLAQIKKARGQFTDDERKLFKRLRRRHFRITGVFWLWSVDDAR